MRPISAKRLRSWRRAWIGCVNYNFRSRTPLSPFLLLPLTLSSSFSYFPSLFVSLARCCSTSFFRLYLCVCVFSCLCYSSHILKSWRASACVICVPVWVWQCEYICVWLCVVVTPAIILSWCGVKCCCCCCCTRIDELTAVRAILASLSLFLHSLSLSCSLSLPLSVSVGVCEQLLASLKC